MWDDDGAAGGVRCDGGGGGGGSGACSCVHISLSGALLNYCRRVHIRVVRY